MSGCALFRGTSLSTATLTSYTECRKLNISWLDERQRMLTRPPKLLRRVPGRTYVCTNKWKQRRYFGEIQFLSVRGFQLDLSCPRQMTARQVQEVKSFDYEQCRVTLQGGSGKLEHRKIWARR